MIEEGEFKPNIVNEELYDQWFKVYNSLHPDAEFLSCVKRDPTNNERWIVWAYNSEKEWYYGNRPTEANCPFCGDITERKICSKSFGKDGKYSLLINDSAPVRGGVLLHYKDHIPMDKSDPEKDLETWLKIAQETGLRIFVNSEWGASIPWHQHTQGYLFEVPFEYFLDNKDDFPGDIRLYKQKDIKDVAGLIWDMRNAHQERTTFVIEDNIGIMPRCSSEEALKYFGVPPSGGPLMGIIGAPNEVKYNQIIKDDFNKIWGNLKKTFRKFEQS